MGNYFKGTILQATPNSETLTWQSGKKKVGNHVIHSSLEEIDHELDTSCFHFSVPISGTENYLVDGKEYFARPGEYFMMHPKQEARTEGVFSKKVDGLCFFLTEKTIAEASATLNISDKEALKAPFDYNLHPHEFPIMPYSLKATGFGLFLNQLAARLENSNDEKIMDWDSFYMQMAIGFLKTHRETSRQLQSIPVAGFRTKEELFKRLSLARNYILENYHSPVSGADLERIALLSKYRLIRLYRNTFGITPYQHILSLRIEKAKILLRKEYAPGEVAAMLSFSDRRAFSKVFKKMAGVAPSKFDSCKSVL